jgi:hypothetical protein
MTWSFDSVPWARAQYTRAMSVAEQWRETALVTGNPRHQATAEICRNIAQEKAADLARLEAAALRESQKEPVPANDTHERDTLQSC